MTGPDQSEVTARRNIIRDLFISVRSQFFRRGSLLCLRSDTVSQFLILIIQETFNNGPNEAAIGNQLALLSLDVYHHLQTSGFPVQMNMKTFIQRQVAHGFPETGRPHSNRLRSTHENNWNDIITCFHQVPGQWRVPDTPK